MKGIMNVLMLGAIGGIVFTAVTHPDGVKAAFQGLDSLYKTSIAGTLGQIA